MPGVCGHGEHGPLGVPRQVSPWMHLCGVVALSSGPGMQHGPSRVGGMGIMAHVPPSGRVPSLTNVVWSGRSFSVEPFGKTIACWSLTKSSGLKWDSLRSEKLAGNGAILYWSVARGG